jgi:hypothetical protein
MSAKLDMPSAGAGEGWALGPFHARRPRTRATKPRSERTAVQPRTDDEVGNQKLGLKMRRALGAKLWKIKWASIHCNIKTTIQTKTSASSRRQIKSRLKYACMHA